MGSDSKKTQPPFPLVTRLCQAGSKRNAHQVCIIKTHPFVIVDDQTIPAFMFPDKNLDASQLSQGDLLSIFDLNGEQAEFPLEDQIDLSAPPVR
jgi:hypothetical protein